LQKSKSNVTSKLIYLKDQIHQTSTVSEQKPRSKDTEIEPRAFIICPVLSFARTPEMMPQTTVRCRLIKSIVICSSLQYNKHYMHSAFVEIINNNIDAL